MIRRALLAALLLLVLLAGCENGSLPPPPPCDSICQDSIALRGMREMLKLVFNLTLQGKPVGQQDATVSCPLGGTAHIFGTATSNAVQGATEVSLTYVFEQCVHLERDEEARENYALTLTGAFSQQGTIAVQPSATTALLMKSDTVTVTGTVHAPPIDYRAEGCIANLAQNGNHVSGMFCQREVGTDL
ncbi:hypothetical protein LVJ94_28975 [Pendulispora rubella]|uniref:Lipoprotein n=1 Tax=Pendulispora rubella TaxID=2741070 RepID=A0ABZ2KQL0_9BACT